MTAAPLLRGDYVVVRTDAGTERGTVLAVRDTGLAERQVDLRFDDNTYCWIRESQVEEVLFA